MQFNWVASTANDAFWSNKSSHVTEQNFIILSSSLKSQCAPVLCLYFLCSLQPDPLEEETAKGGTYDSHPLPGTSSKASEWMKYDEQLVGPNFYKIRVKWAPSLVIIKLRLKAIM
jgi:hypothetical protein